MGVRTARAVELTFVLTAHSVLERSPARAAKQAHWLLRWAAAFFPLSPNKGRSIFNDCVTWASGGEKSVSSGKGERVPLVSRPGAHRTQLVPQHRASGALSQRQGPGGPTWGHPAPRGPWVAVS